MSDRFTDILKRYWGFDSFRGIQREIIESIASGRDTLGLMPTGGGKSVTFQVPALASEGVCIVITPLIALMKDQVEHLTRKKIPAAAIHTGMGKDQITATLEKCVFGKTKLLYVSPERLSSELFLKKLRHIDVSFICVDEAHCISQWGYDFRPSYLSIADIRKVKPEAAILALTATATPDVIDDIQKQLAFRAPNVFKMSFRRDNLSYIVRRTMNKTDELVHILRNVEGSAIVYVRSRRMTKDVSDWLNKMGISSTFYHAGLETFIRDVRQKEWQQDRKRVMVATNAFGMGIDKPDVRVVVHMDCPDSIEAYFQEAGRAGRDGQKSYAVLLDDGSNISTLKHHVETSFPNPDYIRDVYEHLAYFYQIGIGGAYNMTFDFDIEKFCYTQKFFPVLVLSSLRILTMSGYIDYEEEADSQARVRFLLDRDDLYRLRQVTQKEDKVIAAMLRNYGGLFSDYQFVNEGSIASTVGGGMNVNDVYMCLKHLDEEKIIRFIPSKRVPRIRYRQRREESEHLIFPPEVYEWRRRRYIGRIKAMADYLTTDDVCRSRLLLTYFGETDSENCGVCDVCMAGAEAASRKERIKSATELVRQLLADKEEHNIDELKELPVPYHILDEALLRMVDDGIIRHDCVTVKLVK